jgi:pimeloyl-ACP methyl ester carboxylesterase
MGGSAQLLNEGSGNRDTLNTTRVPVVFVPGVMGTRLEFDDFTFGWDPDDISEMADWAVASGRDNIRARIDFRTTATIMKTLDIVRLGQDPNVDPVGDMMKRRRMIEIGTRMKARRPPEQRSDLKKFFESRGWGEVPWTVYGPFLMQLTEALNAEQGTTERVPIYVCGYDWRQSNAESGNLLVTCIDNVLSEQKPAKQVIVVTHSMGGLVTRAAIKQAGASKIAGVLHCVIPADGAVVAYRRFHTGAQPKLNDGPAHFCNILGPTPDDYVITQSGARGPTELLPHDSYPDTFLRMARDLTNKFFPDIFDAYSKSEPPGIVPAPGPPSPRVSPVQRAAPLLRKRLKEAGEFTRSIAGVVHPNTLLLIGDQLSTDVEFDWTKAPDGSTLANREKMVVKRDAGDGTVPSASARFDSAGTSVPRQRLRAGHGECFNDKDFALAAIERVKRLLAEL